MSDFKNRQSAEILNSVYRNADMACHASDEVLKQCRNTHLYHEIAAQRDRYLHVAKSAKEELTRRGQRAKPASPATKAMSKMGIAMRTWGNHSSSAIASLMIRGTTMGIIDMQHAVNRSCAAEPSIKEDAQELLRREQEYCESLKRYL